MEKYYASNREGWFLPINKVSFKLRALHKLIFYRGTRQILHIIHKTKFTDYFDNCIAVISVIYKTKLKMFACSSLSCFSDKYTLPRITAPIVHQPKR